MLGIGMAIPPDSDDTSNAEISHVLAMMAYQKQAYNGSDLPLWYYEETGTSCSFFFYYFILREQITIYT